MGSAAAAEIDADRVAVGTVLRAGHPSLDGLGADRVAVRSIRPCAAVVGWVFDRAPNRARGASGKATGSRPPKKRRRDSGDHFPSAIHLLAQDQQDLATLARIYAVEEEISGAVEAIRALGISIPADELFSAIADDTPMADLMRIGLDGIGGAETGRLIWGERRTFEAQTGFLPPNVDARFRWRTRFRTTVRRLLGANSEQATAELGPEQWAEWALAVVNTPRPGFERGMPAITALSVGVTMEVGPRRVDSAWTCPMTIDHTVPDHLAIEVSPEAPRDADADPTGPRIPRVLQGARLRADPSWLPRAGTRLLPPVVQHLLDDLSAVTTSSRRVGGLSGFYALSRQVGTRSGAGASSPSMAGGFHR